MKKDEFLDKVRRSWEKWESSIDEIQRTEYELGGFCGEWSVKDVIAHITWHEREMIHIMKVRKFEGSELWQLPTDERNDIIYKQCKNFELDDVLRDAQAVHKELVAQLEALPEGNFNDPAAFPGMPEDWKPWEVIADNTHDHYDNHGKHVDKWIKRSG